MIISEVQRFLPSDLLQFSRVVVLDNNDPLVMLLQEVCPLTNGGFRESPKDFSLDPLSSRLNFVIEKAYIPRCQKS